MTDMLTMFNLGRNIIGSNIYNHGTVSAYDFYPSSSNDNPNSGTQEGDVWVAEETVNDDYSLHLERKKGGYFHISQRSSDTGTFVPCALPPWLERTGQFIDHSFGHGVYPMHIKIVSETEVTMGTIREAES